jgi:hypothetical protein
MRAFSSSSTIRMRSGAGFVVSKRVGSAIQVLSSPTPAGAAPHVESTSSARPCQAQMMMTHGNVACICCHGTRKSLEPLTLLRHTVSHPERPSQSLSVDVREWNDLIVSCRQQEKSQRPGHTL